MSGRNVDFFAVLMITLAMIGFSKVSSLRLPDPIESIRFTNAIQIDSCPLPGEIVSRINTLLRP